MDIRSLESAFRNAFGAFWGEGSMDAFYAFFDERALMVDEDNPFVLDKTLFRDHVDFHTGGNWESLEWIPKEARYSVVGETGVVTTFFTLRGKPTGAGFRLRHGLGSVLCHFDRDAGTWRGVGLMLDPMLGHIEGASPG